MIENIFLDQKEVEDPKFLGGEALLITVVTKDDSISMYLDLKDMELYVHRRGGTEREVRL